MVVEGQHRNQETKMSIDETMKQVVDLLKGLWPTYKPIFILTAGFGVMTAVMNIMKRTKSPDEFDSTWKPETYEPHYPQPKRHYNQPVNPFKHRFSQKKVR